MSTCGHHCADNLECLSLRGFNKLRKLAIDLFFLDRMDIYDIDRTQLADCFTKYQMQIFSLALREHIRSTQKAAERYGQNRSPQLVNILPQTLETLVILAGEMSVSNKPELLFDFTRYEKDCLLPHLYDISFVQNGSWELIFIPPSWLHEFERQGHFRIVKSLDSVRQSPIIWRPWT